MTGKDETRPSEGEGQGAKCGQGQRDAGAGRERSDVRQALRKKNGSQYRPVDLPRPAF